MNATVLSAETGWIILAAFSIVWIGLGWYWGRHTKTFDGHVLAGRNVGLALATATAMATWITSNTTMTAPQLAYQLGIWGMVGYSLGAVGLMLFAPIAERVKHLIPNGYTSGDFVRTRYGPTCWLVFIMISLFYGLGWLVSMGMAGGILLKSLTGIPYHVGMLAITSVCVGYTLLGGLRAVIGTDFIQTVIILLGLLGVGLLTLLAAPPSEVHAHLEIHRPQLLDLLMPASLMFLFNNLLFGVGEIFHSNVWWSRAYAFRKGKGFKAFFIAGLAWLPVPVAAGAIALAAPALNINIPALDMVGPLVVGKLAGAFGAVIILVVVFSSLASSLDSLLAATSDLLVEDVYRRLFRPKASGKELRWAARMIVLALGFLSIVLCWGRLTTLAELLHFVGAFVASTIWPIAAGLYWKNTNRHAASLAMIVGSAAGLYAYFSIGFFTAALIGAAVSMAFTIAGTLIAPQPFSWEIFKQLTRPEEES